MGDGQKKLHIVPCSLAQANEYVERYHRHHKKAVGCKFCLAVADEEGVVHGVAIVGRPVARNLDKGTTLEVNRLCTDGTDNACSALYAAAARCAREMGYRQLITYILESEPGTSLKASGWKFETSTSGGSWSVPSRPRIDKAPTCPKQRWAIEFAANPSDAPRFDEVDVT